MQIRREKGLCYNCDEKFHVGHKCKAKQLLMIVPKESAHKDLEEEELEEMQVLDASA